MQSNFNTNLTCYNGSMWNPQNSTKQESKKNIVDEVHAHTGLIPAIALIIVSYVNSNHQSDGFFTVKAKQKSSKNKKNLFAIFTFISKSLTVVPYTPITAFTACDKENDHNKLIKR